MLPACQNAICSTVVWVFTPGPSPAADIQGIQDQEMKGKVQKEEKVQVAFNSSPSLALYNGGQYLM